MPITVNDVVEVTIKYTMEGREANNVTHWEAERPIEFGNSQTVAERVLGAFQDELLPFLSLSVDLIGADYVDLDSLEGDSGSIGPVSGKPNKGLANAAALPPNCALLVRKHTEGGRTNRGGRMYLMGLEEGSVGNRGDLTPTSLAGWGTALDAFLAEANHTGDVPSELRMCVVRRPPSGVTAGESFRVTDLSAAAIIGSQRERMR